MQLPLDFQKFFVKNIQKIKNGLRPSPPPLSRQSLPLRGSREAADNFCLIVHKHDEARGRLGTRQTIFASLCASTMRQGEAGILAHCLFYAGSAAASLTAFAAPPFSLRTSLASAEAIRTSSSAEDTPSASIGSSFSDSA